MNAFDALFVVALLSMLLALVRVRPALLILAANQAIALRALSNIARYGKPASQAFLPDAVFSSENLTIAAFVFAITTGCTLLFSALPARTAPCDPASLPRVPSWLFRIVLLYFVLLALSERTILSQAYSDPDRLAYSANLGGGTAFLNSIFLYEMIRRTRTGELGRVVAFTAVFLVFVATDYLHGSTGLATGFVLTAAMLIFSTERPRRRFATITALLVGLFLFTLSVRVLRATFSSDDAAGVSQVATSLRESNAREKSSAQGVESMGNGTQYAAHVLECITLYEAGESRQWRSVYLPLVYTFEPSVLMRPLGIERPKEAAWELADYFIHGGGIFVIGELYWNGGYVCVILVFFALCWVCWKSDVSQLAGFTGLLFACNIGPNLLQGTGYGFAQVCRGIINGALAFVVYKLVRRFRPGTARSPSQVVRAS